MAVTIYAKEANLLEFTGHKDAVTGAPINDAALTWRIFDRSSAAIVATGSLTYVAGSAGDYRATLTGAVTELLLTGGPYMLILVGTDVYREVPIDVVVRGET
ncbi:MAG: hypothetical protein KatS3mg038_1406 [Candidatus Kapaibacterium sp.]|nr:MAG: hypothetical protein KatS3mg038_1406 [Candidatus Kapabacteria bacterium]